MSHCLLQQRLKALSRSVALLKVGCTEPEVSLAWEHSQGMCINGTGTLKGLIRSALYGEERGSHRGGGEGEGRGGVLYQLTLSASSSHCSIRSSSSTLSPITARLQRCKVVWQSMYTQHSHEYCKHTVQGVLTPHTHTTHTHTHSHDGLAGV